MGNYLLYASSSDGDIAGIKEALANGAEINSRGTIECWTALMCAARHGRMEAIRFLLENGANPNLHGWSDNETAYSVAKRNGHVETANFLRPLTLPDGPTNPYCYRPLFEAIRQKNAAEVRSMLETGRMRLYDAKSEKYYLTSLPEGEVNSLSIDFKETWIRTPLLQAWNENCDEIIRILIEFGADPNWQDASGDTVLSCVARDGNVNMVDFLMKHGANCWFKQSDGRWFLEHPLPMRVARYFEPILKGMAVLNDTVINAKNMVDVTTGESTAMNAAGRGDLAMLKSIHERHANFNLQDKDGWTALFYAAAGHQVDSARFLIQAGVDLELKARDSWTALMVALDHQQKDIVDMMCRAGAKIGNWAQNRVCDVCELVVAMRNPVLVEMLLQYGADPELPHPTNPFMKPLIASAVYRETTAESIKILVRHGAKVDSVNDVGQTPLMLSVVNANVMRALLECGADVSIKDRDGETVFDYVAKKGADPNAKSVLEDFVRGGLH